MAETTPRRKLAAILAADVVGFSKMMGENEDQTLQNLKSCRALTDKAIAENHGRIFGSAGDSVIAEFASPVDAMIAAVDFQKNIASRNEAISAEKKMQFRVGLNLGDVIVEGDNLFGDGVNIAARLEASAEPGGITLSSKFHDEIYRKLDLSFVSTGSQEMKNISEPVATYKIELFNLHKGKSPVKDGDELTSKPSEERIKVPQASKPPAIAALPFANMSGDTEQEYFADGITEDIITNLSLWRTFPVISRNSSFAYRDKSSNLKQVADELGARYILEGSVRKSGNRVRITAQLIDAGEDHHLWSEKWDRTLEDIFDVQDEVSEAIARRVAPSITGHEQIKLTRKRPENFSGWEEYLQGLNSFHGRQRTDHEDPKLAEAREHFERAINLDPTLSDAHSYIAFCCFFELVHQITKDSKNTRQAMLNSAQHALALNPEDPVALGAIASYHMFSGDYATSRDYAKQAIKFNPSFAINYYRLSLALVHYGEFQGAVDASLKTFELSPVDPELGDFYTGLCLAYLGQEKYEESLEAADKMIQHYPDRGSILGIRASILGHLNQEPEGTIALDRYLSLRPNLKTRDNYRNSFLPNSVLSETIIEGLIKSGWKPEE